MDFLTRPETRGDVDPRLVWIPFHFVPGSDPDDDHKDEFFGRIVCRPNSGVAREMVRSCIRKKERLFGLHLLGITAHAFADTWAHQGFAGIWNQINLARDVRLDAPHDDVDAFVAKLGAIFFDNCFPMGHAAVLHYPDHPFRKWSYVNVYDNKVERDNPADFLEAADGLCKVFRRYRSGNPDPNVEVEGLPIADKTIIAKKLKDLNTDDGDERNDAWLKAVRDGEFSFGGADPQYEPFGPNSWKCKALGTPKEKFADEDEFDYKSDFLRSDWKRFHDAAQAHQFEVLREILPKFGICVI